MPPGGPHRAASCASYRQAQETLGRTQARNVLSAPQVAVFRLQLVVSGLRYQAGGVFSGRGVLQQSFPGRPAQIGESFGVRPNAIRAAVRSGRPAVSQVVTSPVLHTPAVAIAVPYPVRRGERIFAACSPPRAAPWPGSSGSRSG